MWSSVYIKPVAIAAAEIMKLLLAIHVRLAVRFGRTPRLLVIPYSKDLDFTLFIAFFRTDGCCVLLKDEVCLAKDEKTARSGVKFRQWSVCVEGGGWPMVQEYGAIWTEWCRD